MARATFITRLSGLTITQHLAHGDRFFDDLRLTNDRAVARSVVTPHVREMIGHLEADWLLSADVIAYGHSPWDVHADTPALRLELLNAQLLRTRLLLRTLWLARDCAANAELGFLISPSGKLTDDIVSSNSISLFFTVSDGTTGEVTPFTREELRQARGVTHYFHPDVSPDPRDTPEDANAFRFSRAMFSIEAARVTSHLPVKIANYCTAFESLFAYETGELTHRLAERLARFLGNNLEERRTIYREVKSAYEVRSRAVHGARPETRHDKLAPISRACDQLLRRALRKIIDTESLHALFFTAEPSPPALREFLLDLALA